MSKLPVAGANKVWVPFGPPEDKRVGVALADDAEAWWVRVGDVLLLRAGGGPLACAATDAPPAAPAGPAPDPGKKADDALAALQKDQVGDGAELDARVLSLLQNGQGKRERSFRSAVGELQETAWPDWPVVGPRTLLWCCRHVLEHTIHPLEHHSRFKQLASLGHADPGAQEHELIMRVLEVAVSYDQLAVSELASFEILLRRAQMLELRHKEKIVGPGVGGTVDEDSHLYLGTGRTRGLIMIAPALEEHVAGELGKEAAAAKERRKLREERSGKSGGPKGAGRG